MKPYLTTWKKLTGKRSISLLILFVSLFLFTGCASVKFYSDSNLTNETGLRYYTLKPYLLVEFKAEKDNTVKTTVIYLPDLANPQYVRTTTGLGSNELEITFENGAVTSYGLLSESQIPETLEAFAAMLSKSAYAAQTFTGEEKLQVDEDETYFRLYEILPGPDGTKLKEIIPGK